MTNDCNQLESWLLARNLTSVRLQSLECEASA
jgi:hypothetical protein